MSSFAVFEPLTEDRTVQVEWRIPEVNLGSSTFHSIVGRELDNEYVRNVKDIRVLVRYSGERSIPHVDSRERTRAIRGSL